MHVLLATTNPGKVREFRQMLEHDNWQWTDLSRQPPGDPVDESGRTFRENACSKAATYARRFGLWTVADDSGLQVDALDGSPGVHSARWAQMHGAGTGDEANNALLLKQMDTVADARRGASFVCVLAMSDPLGRILLTVRRTVEGRILRQARGTNGFGYDPLFLVDPPGRTTAELPSQEKHRISHRGQALREMRRLIDQLGLG